MTDLCKLRHTPRFQAEFDGRLTYFSIDKCTGRGIGAFLPGQFKIVDLLDAFLDVDALQDRPGYLPPVKGYLPRLGIGPAADQGIQGNIVVGRAEGTDL